MTTLQATLKPTSTELEIPHENDDYVAVDDELDFSDVGSSLAGSDLTSLTSTITDHVYENGRRYHSLSAGKYVLPNDEAEQDRLDMQRHATSLMLGGALHTAPLPKKLGKVLDCGTGTGIWAIQFADEHPEAEVVGVDLSPIQPGWVPPNCTFEIDDLEKPWLWKEKFDFVHSSQLGQGIHDWPKYTKNVFNSLNPGGTVEFEEVQISPSVFQSDDNSVPPDGYIRQYEKEFQSAIAQAGLRLDVALMLETYMKQAGFVDVRAVVKKLTIGPWPKDPKKKNLGRWGLAIIKEGLQAYGVALFTRERGLSHEEATELCDNAFKEFSRRDVHTFFLQWFVSGRKPLQDEKA